MFDVEHDLIVAINGIVGGIHVAGQFDRFVQDEFRTECVYIRFFLFDIFKWRCERYDYLKNANTATLYFPWRQTHAVLSPCACVPLS